MIPEDKQHDTLPSLRRFPTGTTGAGTGDAGWPGSGEDSVAGMSSKVMERTRASRDVSVGVNASGAARFRGVRLSLR